MGNGFLLLRAFPTPTPVVRGAGSHGPAQSGLLGQSVVMTVGQHAWIVDGVPVPGVGVDRTALHQIKASKPVAPWSIRIAPKPLASPGGGLCGEAI